MAKISNLFRDRGFGGPAPWVDLVNSQLLDGFGNPTECLDDPVWLRTFADHWKLRSSFEKPESLKSLHALRSLLRRLVEKSAGRTLGSEDVARLNDWLKVPVFPRRIDQQGGLELALESVQIRWESEIGKIARSFAESLAHDGPGRLKICANADCLWAFVDHTKGNVRRWCDDATCGNRDRVRRSRAAAAKHRKTK
jgi:predicted RNA-binding Zn ribbon-like protein